tara:strand:+ start:27 stop:521 length:495 start_codon:yes stop_codon:yes gene_type:complete
MDKEIKEWSFAFFDLGSKESTRRVRLHRNLRRVGAALHSQSVYCMPYSKGSFNDLKDLDKDMFVIKADVDEDEIDELVRAYDSFTTSLITEIHKKLEALEDAKASATDMQSRRGYTKRLNKMYERLDHLEYVAILSKNTEVIDTVENFKKRVVEIDYGHSGQLI